MFLAKKNGTVMENETRIRRGDEIWFDLENKTISFIRRRKNGSNQLYYSNGVDKHIFGGLPSDVVRTISGVLCLEYERIKGFSHSKEAYRFY